MRCAGCGKPIEDREQVVKITTGTLRSGEVAGEKGWGFLHRACFLRAIDSPSVTMEEIKKASRKTA